MFDDDDQFDLTDDPFEWDMLLDDDELERNRKKRQDKNAQGDASKKQDKRLRGLFGGFFGYNRRIAASVYLARVEHVAK